MIRQLVGQIKQRRFYLGLMIIIGVQTVGLVAQLITGQIWYAWAGLGGSFLIALGLGWMMRHVFKDVVDNLTSASQTLATDCENVSAALKELAQGNFEANVKIQSKPLVLPNGVESDPLVQAFNATVNNIQVVAEDFKKVTEDPLERICYVGTDYYLDGRICGEAMGLALHGKGQVAITQGFFDFDPLQLRRQGFESIIREKYPRIEIVDVGETGFEPELAYTYAQNILTHYPKLNGFYVSDGIAPTGVARAVTETKGAGRIKIICHDLVGSTAHYLRHGVITATLSQDLFTQGHDSVIHLFNHLVTGWRPSQPRLLTHLQLVTPHNYKEHWQPDNTLVEAAHATDRLVKPIKPSPHPIRIAMHNRDISEVDRQLQAGALVAAAKLRAYNARVEFIPGGALRVNSVIETVIDQGYDALIVLAANKQDIFYVNRAVYMGIPVVTYNAEPISLRGVVNSLGERLEVLLGLSRGLSHIANNSLTPISAGIANCQNLQPFDPTGPSGERSVEIVRQAIEFMQENIEQPINVADVAQSLYLNSAYFSRLFTEQTGRNPSDVLTEMRLERAKQYLAQTDMSVVDVAVALGYDRSYFSRLFKSRVGCSPGQYAAQQRSR